MDTLFWLLIIMTTMYGGLMMIGGLEQIKQKRITFHASITMILSGLSVLISPLIESYSHMLSLSLLCLGLLAIFICAYVNRHAMHFNYKPIYHYVRGLFSISVIVLFLHMCYML